MGDCIFCDIVDGKAEATVVWQDDLVCAFLDIQPVNAGHIDIVPNQHVAYLADMPPDTGGRMFIVALRIAQALRDSGLPCEGVNMFLADGEAAMQEIFHVHLHVFPRVKDDGFGLKFGDDYFRRPSRAELNQVGERIRRTIEHWRTGQRVGCPVPGDLVLGAKDAAVGECVSKAEQVAGGNAAAPQGSA